MWLTLKLVGIDKQESKWASITTVIVVVATYEREAVTLNV